MNGCQATEVMDLHKRNHGVNGMLFSIDCSHLAWKNCPMQWQGMFKNGKEGRPTIVMEAGVDCDLFFWHVAFGFPGTQNDINIWDRSPLHHSIMDGSFGKNIDPIANAKLAMITLTNVGFWLMEFVPS